MNIRSIAVFSLILNLITPQAGNAAEIEQRQVPLGQHRMPPATRIENPNFTSQSSFPNRETWALFLGARTTLQDVKKFHDLVQAGKLINPFTGQTFGHLKVFSFGRSGPLGEPARVLTDHLEVHSLTSLEELRGYHFDFAICHSNGCTYSISAHKSGIMRTDNFFAMGTDWTSKDFRPGDLKGANLSFFIMKGDPIWKILAPNPARITENTPGLKFTFRGDTPMEILRGFRNVFTAGRADPERFLVIRLDTPPGQRGTLTDLFRPHALLENYFPAIGKWMKSESKVQNQIRETISQRTFAINGNETRRIAPGPIAAGAHGGTNIGSVPTHTTSRVLPSREAPDPRAPVAPAIRDRSHLSQAAPPAQTLRTPPHGGHPVAPPQTANQFSRTDIK